MTPTIRKLLVRSAILLVLHAVGALAMVQWRTMEVLLAGGADASLAMVALAAGFVVVRLLTYGLVPGMLLLALILAGREWKARQTGCA